MNVMTIAWKIYRTLVGDHIAKLAQALKEAWAQVKKSENTTEEKLISVGYKAWERNNHKRIYINDFTKYNNFEYDKSLKWLEINGVAVQPECNSREYRDILKAYQNDEWKFKIYYDCNACKWVTENVNNIFEKDICDHVIEHFENLKIENTVTNENTFKKMFKYFCWECGRGFNHVPAYDGTCGDCT